MRIKFENGFYSLELPDGSFSNYSSEQDIINEYLLIRMMKKGC